MTDDKNKEAISLSQQMINSMLAGAHEANARTAELVKHTIERISRLEAKLGSLGVTVANLDREVRAMAVDDAPEPGVIARARESARSPTWEAKFAEPFRDPNADAMERVVRERDSLREECNGLRSAIERLGNKVRPVLHDPKPQEPLEDAIVRTVSALKGELAELAKRNEVQANERHSTRKMDQLLADATLAAGEWHQPGEALPAMVFRMKAEIARLNDERSAALASVAGATRLLEEVARSHGCAVVNCSRDQIAAAASAAYARLVDEIAKLREQVKAHASPQTRRTDFVEQEHERKVQALRDELAKVTEDRDLFNSQFKAANDRLGDLQIKRIEQRKTIEDQARQIAELRERLAKVSETVNETNTHEIELSRELANVKEQRLTAEASASKLRERVRELEAQAQRRDELHRSTATANAKLQHETEMMRADMMTIDEDRCALRMDLTEAQGKIARMTPLVAAVEAMSLASADSIGVWPDVYARHVVPVLEACGAYEKACADAANAAEQLDGEPVDEDDCQAGTCDCPTDGGYGADHRPPRGTSKLKAE